MLTFSYNHVEAALCAWEWMLENETSMEAVWNANGTSTLRMHCAELGPYIDQVYQLIPEDVRGSVCFDWDVVPTIMRHVEWLDHGGYEVPSAEALALVVTGELWSMCI